MYGGLFHFIHISPSRFVGCYSFYCRASRPRAAAQHAKSATVPDTAGAPEATDGHDGGDGGDGTAGHGRQPPGPAPSAPRLVTNTIYSNERRRKADTPSESTRARRMLKDCHRGLGCFGAELRTFWAGLLVPNIMFEYTPPHRAREREKKARAERHPRIKQRVPR